jgi:hypothetical protein
MRRIFDDQWVFPVHKDSLTHSWFRWYEANCMAISLDGITIDRPVFIVSLPRSGSSMLQDLLCAHPSAAYITNMMYMFQDCFCAAEHFRKMLNLEIRGERFLGDSVEVGGGTPADPVGMWAGWMKHDAFALEWKPCRITDFTPVEITSIRDAIRRVLWCFGGANRRFICKSPALLPHVLFLRDLLPGARFIHLVRDARQTANSLLKLYRLCDRQWHRIRTRHTDVPDLPTFVPYPRLEHLSELVDHYGADNLETTARVWNEAIAFVDGIRPEIPAEQFHQVRYEDIVAHPREEMARIFRFIDLPEPGPSCKEYQSLLSRIGKVRHQNTYGGFELVEKICGPTLKRYGYM